MPHPLIMAARELIQKKDEIEAELLLQSQILEAVCYDIITVLS